MGLAAATLLASRGAIISLADVNVPNLDKAKSSLPGSEKHIATVVDVRRSGSVDAWIDRTVKVFGKLDGAVNFAGIISPFTTIADMTDEMFDSIMSVNARGMFSCLRAEIRAMKEGGSIVSSRNPTLSQADVLQGIGRKRIWTVRSTWKRCL